MSSTPFKLIECPRDAMQGIHDFIPTDIKIKYINQLLKVGYHTLDFGSFVSPKAIPQLRDTKEVLEGLDLSNTKSKLLAIIGNEKGAEIASEFEEIDYLGFPFSISETFQQRNINSTVEESFERLAGVHKISEKNNKTTVAYISMAFGNPYGDEYSVDLVLQWSERILKELGIKIISLSDTVGVATPEEISTLFNHLLPKFKDVTFGAHLHTTQDNWRPKVDALLQAGCSRIDTAILGLGGCPMAKDDLTGNLPTEHLFNYLCEHNVKHGLNGEEFTRSISLAQNTFPL